MKIEDFIERIINGTGGFKTWESREFVVHEDREKSIAGFVIRCLANPDCEGSKDVLNAIEERRLEMQGEKIKLSLDIVNSFNLEKKPYRSGDPRDKGYTYYLPSGIELVGFFALNDEPCEIDALEGLDGFIYIDTKEELKELISLNYDEIIDKVSKENPDFNQDEY